MFIQVLKDTMFDALATLFIFVVVNKVVKSKGNSFGIHEHLTMD